MDLYIDGLKRGKGGPGKGVLLGLEESPSLSLDVFSSYCLLELGTGLKWICGLRRGKEREFSLDCSFFCLTWIILYSLEVYLKMKK